MPPVHHAPTRTPRPRAYSRGDTVAAPAEAVGLFAAADAVPRAGAREQRAERWRPLILGKCLATSARDRAGGTSPAPPNALMLEGLACIIAYDSCLPSDR